MASIAVGRGWKTYALGATDESPAEQSVGVAAAYVEASGSLSAVTLG